ncbi:FkbM family methyltransferase [Chlamydiales bacterium]|nr:FkbM family methyltransferase [Chlamydiales bacterium]
MKVIPIIHKVIFFFVLLSFQFIESEENIFSLESIAKYLPNNPVIIECGAHIGFDTAIMSEKWPSGVIYAFEASPEVYKKLKARTINLKNVHTFPLALGDTNGTTKFYPSNEIAGIGEFHGGNYAQGSLLPANEEEWMWDHISLAEPINTPVKTLDAWAKENNVQKVDFMWLDMQGFDFQMLMASPDILKTVSVIKIEVSFKEFYKGTILFDEGKKFLEDKGFKCLGVDSDLCGDAIFIKK